MLVADVRLSQIRAMDTLMPPHEICNLSPEDPQTEMGEAAEICAL